MSNEFKKLDNGKTRWDLLPVDALEAVAQVLTFGVHKYGDDNWRSGNPDHNRIQASLLRHYRDYKKGIDLDSESGMPHLAHMATNAIFLLEYHLNNVGNDNRFIYSKQVTAPTMFVPEGYNVISVKGNK